jgi:hypothetical protein
VGAARGGGRARARVRRRQAHHGGHVRDVGSKHRGGTGAARPSRDLPPRMPRVGLPA